MQEHDRFALAALPGAGVARERFGLHAPAGRPFRRRAAGDAPAGPQSRFAEHTIALLRSAGGQSPVAYEAADIHTALGMVASHLGLCLVGHSVGRGSRRDLAFLPMTNLKDKAAVFAVTKAGESSKLVSAFVDTLVATARS